MASATAASILASSVTFVSRSQRGLVVDREARRSLVVDGERAVQLAGLVQRALLTASAEQAQRVQIHEHLTSSR
jgi:hypothetical protein